MFKKLNFPPLINDNHNKSEEKMLKTINKIKQEFGAFYDNIKELHLTEKEIKKYIVLIFQCAISHLKNKENKTFLIKKLYRSKVFNTIEIKEINSFLQSKLAIQTNRFIVLGIDEAVYDMKNIEIRQNSKKREFIKYILNSIEKKHLSNFLIFGPMNSGKTFLTSLYAKKLLDLKDDLSIAFINWNQWVSNWRLSFNKQDNMTGLKNEQICRNLYDVDFLFFDDFAKPRLSEWERETIFLPIFKYRRQKKLPIGIITNLNKRDLLKRINLGNGNIDEMYNSFFGNFQIFKL